MNIYRLRSFQAERLPYMKKQCTGKVRLLCVLCMTCLVLSSCYVPPDEITDSPRVSGAGSALPFATIPPATPTPSPTPTVNPYATVNWDGWDTLTTPSTSEGISPASPSVIPTLAVLATPTLAPLRTLEVVTSRPTATPTPAATAMRKGSSGANVRTLQQRLKTLGFYTGKVDGDFGTATENAVKAFQRANGLTVDGKVGSETLKKMNSSSAVTAPKATATATPRRTATPTPRKTATPTPRRTATPRPTATPNIDKYLRVDSEGSSVTQLQKRLIELGWLSGKADGDYGAATEAAVRAFQSAGHLWTDGIAGPDTLALLYSSNAPKSNNAAASVGEKLQSGSEGQSVRALQRRLRELGFYKGSVDGSYGRETEAAVMAFQLTRGLKVDGIAGEDTLAKLYASDAPSSKSTATPAPTSNQISSTGYVTLEQGSSGSAVRQLQQKLKSLGYYTGSVDGNYGNATVTAVIDFQKAHYLKVDGKAGPATQRALYSTSSGKTTYSTLRPGDSSNSVRNLQYTLYELGYYDGSVDGIYGQTTADAVRAFQIQNKISPVDGIAGNSTLTRLYSSDAIPDTAPSATYTTLRSGDSGENVLELKDALLQLGYETTRNAEYDYSTEMAVRQFQQRNGLHVDGVAGEDTQRRLYSANPVANQ